MIGRETFTNCENFGRFHQSKSKKIKGKAKLSLGSASNYGALVWQRKSYWYLLHEKIVRTLFIAFWWLFSDLLKKKHKNFLEKHYAGARQRWAKTLWSHLKRINWYIKMKPFGKYVFWFSFPVCLMMYWNREEWLYNITLEAKRLRIFYFSRRSMHPKPLPKWRVMFESRIHV